MPANKPTENKAAPTTHKGTWLGKYQLIRKLGQGGMGTVYLGVDSVLQRQVAVKVLTGSDSRSPATVQRFLREARAAARINHPNVVAVHDVSPESGSAVQANPANPDAPMAQLVAWLVMELVPGGSVHDLLSKKGPLPWQEATRIVIQACRGLAAAHDAGLVHRDIKPANLLMAGDLVKLADFGLVKVVDLEGTAVGSSRLLGTPHYMSPEQCRGEAVDERTDIYALAATYYTLLTARPPFERDSSYAILFAHCSDPLPDPRAYNPDIPDQVVTLLNQAMAKSRAARPASARLFLRQLEAVLGDTTTAPSGPVRALEPMLSVSQAVPSTIAHPHPSRRLWLVVVGVAILSIILSGLSIGYLVRSWPRSKVQAEGKRLETVVARLQKDNPEFDGKVSAFDDDDGLHLELSIAKVTNLSALHDLPTLRHLKCVGVDWFKGALTDLESLRGLPLTHLAVLQTPVKSLEPIRDMKLVELDIMGTYVADLSPLKKMPLQRLVVDSTGVIDLEQVRHLPLRELKACQEGIHDLSPLADVKTLERLSIYSSRVANLEPLRGLPLRFLDCQRGGNHSFIRSLEPLTGTPLEVLRCEDHLLTDPKLLPWLKSLKEINRDAPEVVLKRVGAL